MNRNILPLLVTSILLAITGSLLIATSPETPSPEETQHVITITENWGFDFDAQPGDRLDVVMVPETLAEGDTYERCLAMGGGLVVDQVRLVEVCQDVDF